MADEASGWIQALVFSLGVIMGTASTITVKVIYSLEALSSDGTFRKFEKPLTTVWCMFLGMLVALPVYIIVALYRAMKRRRGEDDDLTPLFPRKTCLVLVIPTLFDMGGTALASVGLMYCTVSIYQLVRCTVMVVVALLKTSCLASGMMKEGEHLRGYQWGGILVNTIAMVLVALTTFVGAPHTAGTTQRDPRVGVLFLLLSCVVQGSQYVYEEKLMKDNNADPLLVIGMEGLWGTLIMLFIVFPLSGYLPGTDVNGVMENLYDSWVMLNNSTSITIILISFIVTVFFYNIFAIYVTHLLSSVWHAILDNFRPVSVWGTDLLFFYVFFQGRFGEPWEKSSWLQFGGMVLLFVGTAIYNGTIPLPCFHYPVAEEAGAEEEEKGLISTRLSGVSTPGGLGRSPGSASGSASGRAGIRIRTPKGLDSVALTSSPLITRTPRTARTPSQRATQGRGGKGYGTIQ